MHCIIPCFYSDYGRYIDEFRGIPSCIDSLKISQRRCLLGLYETTKKGKFVKAAKVVGYVIGELHPHGDASAYETIKKLVWLGFVKPQGNWGAIDLKGNDKPAAQRYTECKLEKWVINMAFKYHKYVPWENLEFENEPIFLPAIVPLGLIGFDNLSGGGFTKTLTPKYSLKDLLTRLKWLLENQDKITKEFIEDTTNQYPPEQYGPCIKPAFRDCTCKEDEPGTFYKILTSGVGKVRAIPHGEIKNGKIYIYGKAPTFNSKSIEQAIDNNEIDIKTFKDLSTDKKNPFYICGEFTPKNKKVNIQQLYKEIYKKYLIKNFTYQCYFVQNKVATLMGIDQVLINNYVNYIDTVKKYKINECNKLIDSLFTTNILIIVRDIIKAYNVTSISDIVTIFNNNIQKKIISKDTFNEINQTWENNSIEISEQDIIDICSNKSIKQLIEIKQNINILNQKIITCKQEITDVGNTCYYEMCDLLNQQK